MSGSNYLMTTSLKGVSSMKLHRDLGVTHATAWFMAYRIREAWSEASGDPFFGPVEADETDELCGDLDHYGVLVWGHRRGGERRVRLRYRGALSDERCGAVRGRLRHADVLARLGAENGDVRLPDSRRCGHVLVEACIGPAAVLLGGVAAYFERVRDVLVDDPKRALEVAALVG